MKNMHVLNVWKKENISIINIMDLNKTLLILLIIVLIVAIMQSRKKPQVIKKVYVEQQHPIYPRIQYDIREVLPPARRTYLRYPYYATRYGVYVR